LHQSGLISFLKFAFVSFGRLTMQAVDRVFVHFGTQICVRVMGHGQHSLLPGFTQPLSTNVILSVSQWIYYTAKLARIYTLKHIKQPELNESKKDIDYATCLFP